jgi:phenylpropionate dioxygenase-like ring-hydroxylating dioxygenase large terminal subunit
VRHHDYDRVKAHLDELHTTGTTTLAPTTFRQASAVYVDPGHSRKEQASLFDRLPLVVAFSSELAEPTAFVSRQAAGTPVLVARQPDGGVRAFLNSCRHRGTEVVWGEQVGCARRFTCPYHGWTYGTDGRLLGITTQDGFPDLDRDAHGLVEVACAERHGMVFVARRPGVPIDLDDFLGPLDAEFAAMELGRFVVERTDEIDLDANWKLVMDGFMENYHVRFLHKDTLSPYIYSDRISFHPLGRHNRAIHPRNSYDPASHTSPDTFLSQVLISYNMLPNVNVEWAGDHFEVYQPEPDPLRPDRCRVRLTLLVRPEQRGQTEKWARNLKISTDIIFKEDFAAAESAQRALSGGAAATELVYGRNEPQLHHFYRQLASLLERAPAEAGQPG